MWHCSQTSRLRPISAKTVVMSNREKIAVVTCMLALFLSHAVLLACAEEPQEKINVRLVWKSVHADRFIPDRKTFPPSEIQAEIESESTSEVGKRFLINTLREQVAKHDRLVFFEGGKIMDVREEGYPFVYFSPNGEYIGFGGGRKGITQGEFEQGSPMIGVMTQFVLMTKQGEFLWRKTPVPDGVSVFDGGEVVLRYCPELVPCRLGRIYDRKGDLIVDFQLLGKQKTFVRGNPRKKPIFAYWEAVGETLWLFSEGGKMLSNMTIKDFDPPLQRVRRRTVGVSDQGKYLFLHGGIQYLTHANGDVISRFSFEHLSSLDFSAGDDYLAILENKQKLYFVECSAGQVLWEISREGELETFQNVLVSSKGNLVLLRSIFVKGKGYTVISWRLRMFDNAGSLVWQETFPSKDRMGHGSAFMADDGSYFIVNADNSLYCYAIGH